MQNTEHLRHITDSSFESDVIKSSKPSIVDFWAEWCGPCRTIGPVFEELAKEYSGKINFFKMNVDENSSTPAKFGIRGIPTLLLFKDGKMFDQIVGAVPKEHIAEILDKIL